MIWTVEFFQLKMMPVAESKDNYIIYIYIYIKPPFCCVNFTAEYI